MSAALLSVMLSACVSEQQLPSADIAADDTYMVDDDDVVSGWVRIKLKDTGLSLHTGAFTRGAVSSGDAGLDEVAAALGATEVRRVFNDGGRFAERRRSFGLHLWYDIRFDDTVPVSRAVSEFGCLDLIDHIQPIYKARLLDADPLPEEAVYRPFVVEAEGTVEMPFNDPSLPVQWNYCNTGELENCVAGADIDVFPVWRDGIGGDPSVIVAVTDQGVQYDHPDLAANMWVNEAERDGAPGVDDDNNGYVDDIYGWNMVADNGEIYPGSHGTHVAGTVAAVNNNGIGVCGVAGGTGTGDGVRIMSVQITDARYNGFGNIPDAYAYAADNGAVISQNSWGYRPGVLMDEAVSDALDYFIATAGCDETGGSQTGPMQGGILLFSAGNNGAGSATAPANDDRTIAVAAINSDYTKPRYSNYGSAVGLSAPGGCDSNDSDYSDINKIYSTSTEGGYAYQQGTSMACPHVSGVAALIVSEYGKPGFTAQECRDRLMRAYRPIGGLVGDRYSELMGVGLVDAALAFAEDSGVAPQAPGSPAASASGNEITFTWSVPADSNGQPVAQFRVEYTSTGTGKGEGIIADGSGEIVIRNYYAVSETLTAHWTGSYNTEYSCEVYAVDRFGNESEGVAFGVVSGDYINQAPSVSRHFDDLVIREAGEESKVEFDLSNYFEDDNIADGDRLSYTFINRYENIVHCAIEGSILTVLPVGKGEGQITVNATDLDGAVVQSVMSITVVNGPDIADEPSVSGMSIYPNPVEGDLHVTLSDGAGEAVAAVYDSAARKVLESVVNIADGSGGVVDVSMLSPGTYTLRLSMGGEVFTASFVKI